MTRTAAALLLGTALALATVPAAMAAETMEPPQVVYGATHIEAALTQALARYVPVGRLHIDLDSRGVELRAPANQAPATGIAVENIYYNGAQSRFAADLVLPGTQPPVRIPVSGHAFGAVEVPVLARPIVPGDVIGVGDVDWIEVRTDQAASDIAASDAQLIGMTPKRGVPVNQPIHLRDIQSPRLVDKGALVSIVLESPNMRLSTQGKALQDGGRGDVIRVVNVQSNRVVEVTVAGLNVVAASRPGAGLTQ